MEIVSLFILSVALAMDSFIVSIAQGLALQDKVKRTAFRVSLLFGVFHVIMPLLGWYLAVPFAPYIEGYDYWVSFFILFIIGLSTLYNAIANNQHQQSPVSGYKQLLLLSLAISIDAFAAGASFAFMSNVHIFVSVVVIGAVATIFSYLGFRIGGKISLKYQQLAEIIASLLILFVALKSLLGNIF